MKHDFYAFSECIILYVKLSPLNEYISVKTRLPVFPTRLIRINKESPRLISIFLWRGLFVIPTRLVKINKETRVICISAWNRDVRVCMNLHWLNEICYVFVGNILDRDKPLYICLNGHMIVIHHSRILTTTGK